MAYVDTWDESKPDGATQRGFELDDEVRTAKRALRERNEGDVTLTGWCTDFQSTAKPKEGMARVFFDTEANLGTKPLEDGRVFISTDTNRLWHLAAAGAVELAYTKSGVAETITALWTFNPGTTPQAAISLDIAALVAAGQRDSHNILMIGRSFDTGAHNVDWIWFVDVTSDAGASTFVFQSRIDVAAFATRFSVTDSGNVLIGTTIPATGSPRLDVVGAAGAIVAASNTSDATGKVATLSLRHFTNAEEPLLLVGGNVSAAVNRVDIGGGQTGFNAATSIEFTTAPNTTTLIGTLRLSINSVGAADFQGNPVSMGALVAMTGNFSSTLGVSGATTLGGAVILGNDLELSEQTIVLAVGANNDVVTGTVSVHRLDTAAGVGTITGLAGGRTGRLLFVVNIGTNTVSLLHQDANSSAANRIITPDGLAYGIEEGKGSTLWYDNTTSRWRVMTLE